MTHSQTTPINNTTGPIQNRQALEQQAQNVADNTRPLSQPTDLVSYAFKRTTSAPSKLATQHRPRVEINAESELRQPIAKQLQPLPQPNAKLLKTVFAPYIEGFARANAHTFSGLEHTPLDRAHLVVMSHSTNTRELVTVIKRLHDFRENNGRPNKLTRFLVDRNLMVFPLNLLFKDLLGCLEASPDNFKRLRVAGESIGLCPEGQRGAITRLDTINWRNRGMANMVMRYNMPVLPVSTAGAEALQRDASDLLGPLKPWMQRPLDFIRDYGYERFSIPVLLAMVTPSGPFPAYLMPPFGQGFADKIHTHIGAPIEPRMFIQAFNEKKGCQLTPEQAAALYRENFKNLISDCYEVLRNNGAYFNDNTERFAQLLDRIARDTEQPNVFELMQQLPTPLHERTQAPSGKSLARLLAERLSNHNNKECFYAFQAIEQFNDKVLVKMNSLLRQAHQVLTQTKGTEAEAKRRLKTNLRTLLLSLPITWLASYYCHSKVLPKHLNQALHGMYLMRVLFELRRDACQILTHRECPTTRPIKPPKAGMQEKFETKHNKLE